MKKILISCLLAATTAMHAQNFQWAKQMGGSDPDNGQSVCIDASGNVFTAGYFEGTGDFDPGAGTVNLSSAGYEDVFVQKMDGLGNFIWARGFGGAGNDQAYSISTDAAGNVFTVGTFAGSGDYDPGAGTSMLTTVGNWDIFIQKMDAAGNFLWAKGIGGNGSDKAWCSSVDAAGNIYTVGHFEGTVDFDPGPGTSNLVSAGNYDIFIQKLDGAGNFVWAKSLGASGSFDIAYGMCVDPWGYVYLTGTFSKTMDFDPGPDTTSIGTNGNFDIFVLKLDASGNYVWARTFGGLGSEEARTICTDNLGNVYTAGAFKATGDYDPGPGTTLLNLISVEDIFVQKMDSAGNFQWARAFGGFYIDNAFSIKTDAAGNVFTAGTYNNTVDFDPGAGITNLYSEGVEDIFVQKMDAAGNFLWAKSLGGTGQDHGRCIAIDATGDVLTTGFFGTVADFDPGPATYNLTTAGLWDVVVQKMSAIPLETQQVLHHMELSVVPNPSAGIVKLALPQEIKDVVLELTDVFGRVISKQYYAHLLTASVELKGASGIYHLKVKTAEAERTIKLVKE